MKILGIESSCDETAAAVVDEHGSVYANAVASQVALHATFGGVVPEAASRAHLTAITDIVSEAVTAAGGIEVIDGVAVTNGPGLVGSLLIGLQFAKGFAFARGLPLIGIDHLEGHMFAPELWLASGTPSERVPRPIVALLVSGGHTAIYHVTQNSDGTDATTVLGQTRDDAAGEAYDKASKLLGLGYPGGPVIDRLALTGDPKAIAFPQPMRGRGLEFSFSGLKTALVRWIEINGVPTGQRLSDVCASYQKSIVDLLVQKSIAACRATSSLNWIVSGGVAANSQLRLSAAQAAARDGITLHVPDRNFCTDQAAMIAYRGAVRLTRGERSPWTLSAYSRAATTIRGKIRPSS